MVENSILQHYSWEKEDFDIHHALSQIEEPIVEVGGPTLGGYSLIGGNLRDIGRKVIVTSNQPEVSFYSLRDARVRRSDRRARIDRVEDVRNLRFANESVGALFASALPKGLWTYAMPEAWRVLIPNGLLVVQFLEWGHIKYAKSVGFDLRFLDTQIVPEGERHAAVLQKMWAEDFSQEKAS